MLRIFLALCLVFHSLSPSAASVVRRSYSYFTVSGQSFDELMAELSTRGPHVKSTGERHPGATKMQFNTRLGYSEHRGRCWISEATVTVKARIILPKWKDRRKGSRELRIYWDTLSADIKRHEEGHVIIAQNYARDLEDKLLALPRHKDCKALAGRAETVVNQVLRDYRRASERFDRVESASFDRRIEALYNYRLERIEAGRLPQP